MFSLAFHFGVCADQRDGRNTMCGAAIVTTKYNAVDIDTHSCTKKQNETTSYTRNETDRKR